MTLTLPKSFGYLLALAFCLPLLGGCVQRPAPDPRIFVLDQLRRDLDVGEPRAVRELDEEGQDAAPLRVAVPVTSKRQRGDVIIQYRFTFFDADQVPLRADPGPQRVLIPAGGRRTLEGKALDTRAVLWELEIQRSRAR